MFENTRNIHVSLTSFRNESRVLKETESLVANEIANEVFVVALHEGKLAEEEAIDDARRVLRLKLHSRGLPKGFLVQLVKYAEMVWRVLRIARQKQATIHNVHSVALLPLGVLLKLACGGKLVYDTHELESEANGLRGVRKLGAKWIEWAFVRFADLVIVVSPGIEKWYRKRYPDIRIIAVLNAPRKKAVARTDRLRDRLRIPNNTKIALYQGGLEPHRGIDDLIAAAPAMKEAGYALVFMGYGSLLPTVEAAVRQNENVYYHPAVPPENLLSYTASADIGFVSIEAGCLSYHLALPNKLFEYMSAGVPSVVSALPEMKTVIEKHGIGVCIENWDSGTIATALTQVDAMRGPELDGRLRAAVTEYCWEVQEQIMIDGYRAMLGMMPTERSDA